MKRLFLSLSLIAMLTLLAGCISIPLGKDVLEISTDGVKLIKGDSSEEAEEDDSTDDEEVDEEDATAEEDETADENETEEDDGDNASESSADTTQASANVTCPEDINTNYDEIIKVLEDDFYFPECADVKSISHGNDSFRFDLYQEGGNYEDLFNEYLEFTGEQVNHRDVNYGREMANLRFYLDPDTETGDISIDFTQRDEGVDMEFNYRIPQPEDEEDDD